MKIRVHIERLVLDGLPIAARDGPVVRAVVERELVRLLTTSGLGEEWSSGGAVASTRAPRITVQNDCRPGELGSQIARSVHGGIGRRP
jgi:hypothetical protein